MAVEVILHASHMFATSGICTRCNCFRGSFAASRGCRGEIEKALGAGWPDGTERLHCTVCEESVPAASLTDVTIREGGPTERMCSDCLRWLRDSLTEALLNGMSKRESA